MLSPTPPHVELDGRQVPPASMLTKGVAVAVDLCLTVGLATLAFYLISLGLPLDDHAARTPVWAVLAVALAYLVFGRDHVFSPGRRIMRLTLVRMPGNVPGLYGRSMSVHVDENPGKGSEQLMRAMLAIALSTLLAMLTMTGALTTTRLYTAVRDHALSGLPVQGVAGRVESLHPLPRELLMSRHRGYVKVDAETTSGRATLEFFTEREARGWRVIDARATSRGKAWANYSLGARDEDVPAPPGAPGG